MTTTLPAPATPSALWASVTAASSAAITAAMQQYSVAAGLPLLQWSLVADPLAPDGLGLLGAVDPAAHPDTALLIARAYSTFYGDGGLAYRDGGDITVVEAHVVIAGTRAVVSGVHRIKATGGAR